MKYVFSMTSLLLPILLFSACEKDNDPPPVVAATPQGVRCASAQDFSLDPKGTVQFREVELVREHQEVVRINCLGQEVSRKVEEVKAPKKTVTIRSLRQVTEPDPRQREQLLDEMSYRGMNRQTCQPVQRDLAEKLFVAPFEAVGNQIRRGWSDVPHHPEFKLTLDYAPALFTTEVNSGIQMIDYQFQSLCKRERNRWRDNRHRRNQEESSKYCRETFEKGTFVFAVKYDQVLLPGTKVVREQDCQQP
ncbi:MAG: hypothetical protein KDD61_04110 [Bdellovibrionales bacterium]|nr:hypothetical protein [Bdellovibrionales bacterium]